jgi:lysyl-tRNA synthetase class II
VDIGDFIGIRGTSSDPNRQLTVNVKEFKLLTKTLHRSPRNGTDSRMSRPGTVSVI